MTQIPGPIAPPARLLMGPGPISAYPRVLRAMSAQLVGQYDPFMTATMTETQQLYRGVWATENDATLLIDGTSRAGIEAAMVSLIRPGDRVLVPGVRPLRSPAGRDRRARDGRGAHDRGAVGAGVPRVGHRGGDRAGEAAPARPRAGRHVDHDAAAARRARRDLRASTACCSTATRPPRSAATRSRRTRGDWMPPPPACRSAWAARRARRPSRCPSARSQLIRSRSKVEAGIREDPTWMRRTSSARTTSTSA